MTEHTTPGSKITRGVFADMCSAGGYRQVTRGNLEPGIDLLIAEREIDAFKDEDMTEPHWDMMWALTRDDKVEDAGTLQIPKRVTRPVKSPNPNEPDSLESWWVTEPMRIDVASDMAMAFLKAAKKAGGWV